MVHLSIVSITYSLWVGRGAPYQCRRWRLRRYAGIGLPFSARVLSEDDQYTFRFMDGTYSIAYRADATHIQDLLSTRPEWASAEWSHGRKTNLAKQLDIPPRPSLLSVESKIGLFRILTVDPTTSTVYFELLEM